MKLPRRSRLSRGIALLTLFFLVGGCASSPKPSGTGTTSPASGGQAAKAEYPSEFRFGVLMPLTGNAASGGEWAKDGLGLALDEINAAGGVKGHKLVPIYEDSQAQAKEAVSGFARLTDIEKVPVVMIGYTGPIEAVAPLATSKRVVLISGAASTPSLAGISPYAFFAMPLLNDQMEAMLKYFSSQKHVKKLAGLYVNDASGLAISQYVKRNWQAAGGEMVADLLLDPQKTDFSSELAKVRAANPDAIYTAMFGQAQAVAVKQIREMGMTLPIYSYAGFEDETVLKVAAKAAEGVIFTAPSGSFDKPEDQLTAKFVESFKKKKNGTVPSVYVAHFYNSALILKQAIERLMEQGKPYTGENMRDAIHLIGTFDGVGGKIIFREDGTASKKVLFKTVKDGKFVELP